jgi:hypothetical protein
MRGSRVAKPPAKGTPMRIAPHLVVLVCGLGLTLGLTPACGSGELTCQNPTAAQQTCITCVNTSCASDVSAVETNCPDYSSCASSCNCGDTACTMKCQTGAVEAGSACGGAALGYLSCLETMCKSQCPITITVGH